MCSETLISTGTSWCKMDLRGYFKEYEPIWVLIVYEDGHRESRNMWNFEDLADIPLYEASTDCGMFAIARTHDRFYG